MQKIFLQFVIGILSLFSVVSFSNEICTDLYKEYREAQEKTYLYISLSDVKSESTIKLATGVYKVVMTNGVAGVLRVNSQPSMAAHQDLEFEAFSHHIMSVFGKNIPIPKRVHLEPDLVNALIVKRDVFEWSAKDALEKNTLSIASFLPFYSGENGSTYLEGNFGLLFRLGLGSLARDFVTASSSEKTSLLKSKLPGLERTWRDLSEKSQESVIENLTRVFPTRAFIRESFSGKDIAEILEQERNGELIELPSSVLFKALPEGVQTQLADLFTIYTILGIHDFHPKNWVIDGENVYPVDLAFKTIHFMKGSEEAVWAAQQSPLDAEDISAPLYHLLKQSISDDLRTRIANIDTLTIQQVGEKLGLSYSSGQYRGMMLRAKSFLF